MGTYRGPDRTCFPADEAPPTTDLVARCNVCGVRWQVRSPSRADAQGCSFCDAPASAVTVISEAADCGGQVVE